MRANLNRYFTRKTSFSALGFEPRTFRLTRSCLGYVCISSIDNFAQLVAASKLGDLAAVA